MKMVVITSLALVGAGVFGCMPRKSADGTSGSNSGLSSVTINQPKLKEAMKASVSDADKAKIYDALVYQISIKAAKTADNKDDCDSGATASSFDSDILNLDKGASDTVKVKKGCNYVVSMKYGMKSADGKSISPVMLQSWDDKDPSKLSKEELTKAKPTATVNLYVTKDGQPYWDISVIQTPGDSDVSIQPNLAVKSFALKVDKVNAYAEGNKLNGLASLIPTPASTKDMFCGVVMVIEYGLAKTAPSQYVQAYLGNGDVTKSMVFVPANSTAAIAAETFVASNIQGDVSLLNARSQTLYAVCSSDAASPITKLQGCFTAASPNTVVATSACATENMIVK